MAKWDDWKAVENVESVINLEEAAGRVRGNDALYCVLLGRFISDTSYARFKEALRASNIQDALLHIHSLKGIAGNLSLHALHYAAQAAEAELKGGAASPEALEALEAEMRKAQAMAVLLC